jgi:hypothetical protein
MSEQEWLAMRGFVDIALCALLLSRLLWHSTQLPSLQARLAMFTVVSLFLALLELLGVWNWREIVAAARMLPIVWPIIALALYLTFKSIKMWRDLQRAQFEIDWRREYQESLLQQLEQGGMEGKENHKDTKSTKS